MEIFTKKEYDQAMQSMECSLVQSHINKCDKCSNKKERYLIIGLTLVVLLIISFSR